MALTEGVNTYTGVNVNSATLYFTDSLRKSDWASFGGSVKAAALVEATRYLERLSWAGSRVVVDQELSWPRAGVKHKSGDVVDSATVPKEIIEASYEIALRLAQDPELLDSFNNQSGGNSNLKSVKAGEVEVQFFTPKDGGPLFDWIAASIGHFIGGSAGGASSNIGAKSSGTGAPGFHDSASNNDFGLIGGIS